MSVPSPSIHLPQPSPPDCIPHPVSIPKSPTESTNTLPKPPRRRRPYLALLPGGFIKKYRQPPSTSIPYPRGELDVAETIRQRRGMIVLGYDTPQAGIEEEDEDWDLDGGWEDELEEEMIIKIVRFETIGGRFKRIWERITFRN